MNCIYCQNPTYKLSNGYFKCKVCKRKFSPKKLERKAKIKQCFCKDYTINRCAKLHRLHFKTVAKEYQSLREQIALFMENEFSKKEKIIEYDEYIYIPKTKRTNKKNIFDGFNFLTYNFDNKIYNILLPSLKRFKPLLIDDNLEQVYYKELEKFLYSYHISNAKNSTLIKEFWRYFEEFMLKFNGIESENFFYYLKEAEFKFNYRCKESLNLLTQ